MTIKIDKDVPQPPSGKATKYPFRDMKVGDSFFSPNEFVSQMASKASGVLGAGKVTCRTVTENGVKGVRVWRIAE